MVRSAEPIDDDLNGEEAQAWLDTFNRGDVEATAAIRA